MTKQLIYFIWLEKHFSRVKNQSTKRKFLVFSFTLLTTCFAFNLPIHLDKVFTINKYYKIEGNQLLPRIYISPSCNSLPLMQIARIEKLKDLIEALTISKTENDRIYNKIHKLLIRIFSKLFAPLIYIIKLFMLDLSMYKQGKISSILTIPNIIRIFGLLTLLGITTYFYPYKAIFISLVISYILLFKSQDVKLPFNLKPAKLTPGSLAFLVFLPGIIAKFYSYLISLNIDQFASMLVIGLLISHLFIFWVSSKTPNTLPLSPILTSGLITHDLENISNPRLNEDSLTNSSDSDDDSEMPELIESGSDNEFFEEKPQIQPYENFIMDIPIKQVNLINIMATTNLINTLTLGVGFGIISKDFVNTSNILNSEWEDIIPLNDTHTIPKQIFGVNYTGSLLRGISIEQHMENYRRIFSSKLAVEHKVIHLPEYTTIKDMVAYAIARPDAEKHWRSLFALFMNIRDFPNWVTPLKYIIESEEHLKVCTKYMNHMIPQKSSVISPYELETLSVRITTLQDALKILLVKNPSALNLSYDEKQLLQEAINIQNKPQVIIGKTT